MQFRERVGGGETLYGAWCLIPGSFSIELIGRANFDWVCLDAQHGFIASDALLGMIQALDLTDTPSLVRVAANDSSLILRALDAGAHGVIVPMIESPEDVHAAVRACRYPPLGDRSFGPQRLLLRNPDYSPEDGNRDVVCIVMIETATALARINEIVSVPGLDGIYIGPRDLGLSLRLPGPLTPDASDAMPAVRKVLQGCARHGVLAGIHALDGNTALRWRDIGFRMINTCVDAVALQRGAAESLRVVRGAPER